MSWYDYLIVGIILLLFILVLIIMSIPVSALTLSGGISYTTETAKSIAFEIQCAAT